MTASLPAPGAASETSVARWPRSSKRRRRRPSPLFVLCIADHDTDRFTLEGPMTDAETWVREVIAARRAGRDITCHVLDASPEEAAQAWMRAHGGIRWPSGSIVAPESFAPSVDPLPPAEPATLLPL
jgi:hypothetical protein